MDWFSVGMGRPMPGIARAASGDIWKKPKRNDWVWRQTIEHYRQRIVESLTTCRGAAE
jgi:hypothetical protein